MKVFILESLKNSDPKTGELVHNYLNSKNFDNSFHTFASKKELFDLLKLVEIESAAGKIQPIVHLDCHGNDDGIAPVLNQTFQGLITWKEIRSCFRSIYTASNFKASICLSSCQGFNAIKMVAHCEPCPYDHVCGSFEKISFKDSYHGYTEFYDLIFNGKSIYDAAVEIHNNPKFDKLKFIGLNSPTLFKMAIDGYIKNECTPQRLEQRKQMFRSIIEQHGKLNSDQEEYLEYALSEEGQQEIIMRCEQAFLSLK